MTHTDIFMRCIEVVLRNEGGLIDNPHDPGGLTNMGICQRNYPNLDIKNLTRTQAIEIYFHDYWSKMNLININNEDLILLIFDMGVNAGIRTAIKMIQRIVKATADGFIGPETTKLINESELDLVNLYTSERRKYYFTLARNNSDMTVFIAGWLRRVDNTHFELVT